MLAVVARRDVGMTAGQVWRRSRRRFFVPRTAHSMRARNASERPSFRVTDHGNIPYCIPMSIRSTVTRWSCVSGNFGVLVVRGSELPSLTLAVKRKVRVLFILCGVL